jgi:predicted ATPase
MIERVTFKEDYEFELQKESQKRFPHKTYVPGKYERGTEPYTMFTIFPKDLMIEFNPEVNVIVGENGSGKSTLISLIKSFVGRPYEKIYSVLHDYKDEEDYLARYQDDDRGPIKVEGLVKYNNSVFFNAEEDNPIVAIPKMANPMSKDFNSLAVQLWFAQEESHGESMLPVINYILDNSRGNVIFMDEPETALSLKNQIRVANKMKYSAKKYKNQIIISTHSLAMIQEFIHIFDMETRTWVKTDNYIDGIK